MLKNLVVVLCTLLGIFLVAESAVRGLQYVERLPDYRKGNISGQPNKVPPPKYERIDNPYLNHEHVPLVRGINRWGTRGGDFEQQKPAQTLRIIAIGDSVTFGLGVNHQDSYPYRLQQRLQQDLRARGDTRRVEVLNFGVSGYGTDAYIELYRSKVRDFQPDLVILGYVQNDPAPANAADDAVKALMQRQARRTKTARYSQFAGWVLVQIETIRGGFSAREEWQYYLRDEVLDITTSRYQALWQLLKQDNVAAVVAIFPYLLDFDDYPLTKVHRVLDERLAQTGYLVCDLLPALAGSTLAELRLQRTDTVHPSPQAYQVAADAIADCLLRNPPSSIGLPAPK